MYVRHDLCVLIMPCVYLHNKLWTAWSKEIRVYGVQVRVYDVLFTPEMPEEEAAALKARVGMSC